MTEIDLKYIFSKKVDFRGGRPHYAYSSIMTGPALGRALRQAEGLASGQAQAHPSCRQVVREVQCG